MLHFALAFAQLALQVVYGFGNRDFKGAMAGLREDQGAWQAQANLTNHPLFWAGGILFLKQDLCTNEKVVFVKKFLEPFGGQYLQTVAGLYRIVLKVDIHALLFLEIY